MQELLSSTAACLPGSCASCNQEAITPACKVLLEVRQEWCRVHSFIQDGLDSCMSALHTPAAASLASRDRARWKHFLARAASCATSLYH